MMLLRRVSCEADWHAGNVPQTAKLGVRAGVMQFKQVHFWDLTQDGTQGVIVVSGYWPSMPQVSERTTGGCLTLEIKVQCASSHWQHSSFQQSHPTPLYHSWSCQGKIPSALCMKFIADMMLCCCQKRQQWIVHVQVECMLYSEQSGLAVWVCLTSGRESISCSEES